MYRILKEDPDFRLFNLPLSEQDHSELERKIASGVCPVTIISWKGYLADGYECYDLCQKYHVPAKSEDWYFSRKENAISWLCKKQLKRSDQCSNAFAWLLYRLYENELNLMKIRKAKDSFQYRQLSPSQFSSGPLPDDKGSLELRFRIAKEFAVCAGTIYRYISFGSKLDQLEKIFPGARVRILTGDLDIARAHIDKILTMPRDQLFHLLADPTCKKLLPVSGKASSHLTPGKKASSVPAVILSPQIKQMPVYDPDSELNALVYTVGSWVKAVTRTNDKADFQAATERGRNQLRQSLSELMKAVNDLNQRLEAFPNE